MKRSSCLSALLVGLSVTTASVAFAAPGSAGSEPTPAKAALVAQAQVQPTTKTVQPSDPTPAGGGAGPTAAPTTPAAPSEPAAAPVESPPTGAVTLGSAAASGAPGSDAPNASGAEPSKPASARRWAGTQIFAASSMTTATVFRGQNQYSNPTVDGALYITPRYAINEAFQLRGRVIFNYEFTNGDDTVTKNEPRFSDTTLQLYYRKIPELPGGIKPMVAVGATLPTSPESRARTLVFTPGLSAQLSKTIEHIPGNGSLDLLASTGYSHPLYRSTTPALRGSAPYGFACVGGTTCQDQLSGAFNPSDSVGYSLVVAATWGKWSPALFYRGNSQWTYTGKDVVNPVDGKPLESPNGFRPNNVRQSSYFSAWLDYEANSWLTAEVGYSLERAELTGNGQVGNPFWDRYSDQRVFIGANFNIDNIMKQLEGAPTEAGIVRAQNTKKSLWNF